MKNLSSLGTTVSFLASQISPVIATPESRLFPFVGAKACKAEIQTNRYVTEAVMALLAHSDTFMSSHVKAGRELAFIVVSGGEWTPEQDAKAVSIASAYSKRLSVALRDHAMALDPSLVATAATFSVKPSAV